MSAMTKTESRIQAGQLWYGLIGGDFWRVISSGPKQTRIHEDGDTTRRHIEATPSFCRHYALVEEGKQDLIRQIRNTVWWERTHEGTRGLYDRMELRSLRRIVDVAHGREAVCYQEQDKEALISAVEAYLSRTWERAPAVTQEGRLPLYHIRPDHLDNVAAHFLLGKYRGEITQRLGVDVNAWETSGEYFFCWSRVSRC